MQKVSNIVCDVVFLLVMTLNPHPISHPYAKCPPGAVVQRTDISWDAVILVVWGKVARNIVDKRTCQLPPFPL